jgi:hypothetical protein
MQLPGLLQKLRRQMQHPLTQEQTQYPDASIMRPYPKPNRRLELAHTEGGYIQYTAEDAVSLACIVASHKILALLG